MKKAIAAFAVTLFVAGSASAASVRDNCGCGLGTMALGDAEPTLIVQLGATFLNAICGNQTFGITSGTLECEPHLGFASNKRILEYVNDNMDHLAMEMAVGQGESLDALADLMEIHGGLRPALYSSLQTEFGTIFSSDEVTALQVVERIDEIVRG
jgi:hypothetical protein